MSNNILDDNNPTPDVKAKAPTLQKLATFAEIALYATTLLGVLFKSESWPYASQLLTIGLLSLAMLYALIPTTVMRTNKIVNPILAYAIGISIAAALIGKLLRIESWPNATTFKYIGTLGMITTAVLILIQMINTKNQSHKETHIKILSRTIPLLFLLM